MRKLKFNHICSGLPSVNFMNAKLKRFRDQRIQFVLKPDGKYKWLFDKERAGEQVFNKNEPVIVNGIYMMTHKRRREWPKMEGPITFFLVLRDVLFKQGDKEVMVLWASRKINKRREWEFDLADIVGMKWLKELQDSLLKLPQFSGAEA